jgi:hypothetical protein
VSDTQDTVQPRFAMTATVIVRETAHGPAILVGLRNISLSGCYLETPRAIPEDSRIRITLEVSNIRADLWGVVRRRDANGLGIQFTNGTTVEDWKRLESFIKEMEVEPRAAKTATASGNA